MASIRIITLCLMADMLYHSPMVLADDDIYPFGRVFTGSSERLRLDRLKLQQSRSPIDDAFTIPPEADPVEEFEPGVPVTRLQFSGYLRRADGKTVLWVNGTEDNRSTQDNPRGQLLDQSNEALFNSQTQQTRLRPGQTWLIDSDNIVEVYNKRKPAGDSGPYAEQTAEQDIEQAAEDNPENGSDSMAVSDDTN